MENREPQPSPEEKPEEGQPIEPEEKPKEQKTRITPEDLEPGIRIKPEEVEPKIRITKEEVKPKEKPEEGQLIEQKIEGKPEEIIKEFETETELTERRIEEIGKKVKEYKETKETNLGLGVPSSIYEAIDRDIAILKEKRQGFIKDVEKRGPSQEEQKIKVEIQGIDAHIKIIQKVEEQDMPGMVPEAIKEGRKRDIQELEKQKKEKEKELQEETLKRIKEYQKEKGKLEGMPISKKEEPREKPEEAPRPVVADALDQKIEETRREVEKLKLEERASERVEEGGEKSGETAKLQELAKLEKQRQQEVERITGRNFAQEARDEFVKEAEANKGYYIDKEGKRWRVRRIPKETAIRGRIERIGKAERSQVFKNQWENLSDQEKTSLDNRIENFINKLEEKRKTLSRQTGVEISQDIFCKFLHSGKLQEVKKTSFLGLFRKRITVPIRQADGTLKMEKYSVKDFRKLIEFNQKRIEEKRREKAEEMWQRGQEVLAGVVAKRVEKKTKEVLEDIRSQELVKEFWEKIEAEPREKREKEGKEARQKHQERLDKIEEWKKRINPFLKEIGAGSLEDFEKRKLPGFEEVAQYQEKQKTIEQGLQEELRRIEQNFKDRVKKLRKQKVSEILQLEELKKI